MKVENFSDPKKEVVIAIPKDLYYDLLSYLREDRPKLARIRRGLSIRLQDAGRKQGAY